MGYLVMNRGYESHVLFTSLFNSLVILDKHTPGGNSICIFFFFWLAAAKFFGLFWVVLWAWVGMGFGIRVYKVGDSVYDSNG